MGTFGSPFIKSVGKTLSPRFCSGLALPRANLLAYYRDGVDTIGESTMLLDRSGNGRHMTVVSGTSWADFVLTAPADDATWIAADTTGIFYLADGTPKEITASLLLHNADNRVFAGDRAIAVYSTCLSDALAAKVERYVGDNDWFGATFGFDGGQLATETFLLSTVGSVNWNLDGALVGSGAQSFTTTNKKGVTFGISGDAVKIDFRNTNITGNIAQLRWISGFSDTFHFGGAKISGDVGAIANIGSWAVYFFNNLIDTCSKTAAFSAASIIRFEGCRLDQAGVGNLLLSAKNGSVDTGTIDVSGGTNVAPTWGTEGEPSDVALAVVDLLQRSWTVTVTGGVPAWVTALV